jgi:hypothetical protein
MPGPQALGPAFPAGLRHALESHLDCRGTRWTLALSVRDAA